MKIRISIYFHPSNKGSLLSINETLKRNSQNKAEKNDACHLENIARCFQGNKVNGQPELSSRTKRDNESFPK